MRIPESTLSEIRDKLDIAEVIGETSTLQRRGGGTGGCAPSTRRSRRRSPSRPTRACSTVSGAIRAGRSSISSWRSRRSPGATRWSFSPGRRASRSRGKTSSGTAIERESFLELYRRVAGSFHWLLMEGPQARAGPVVPGVAGGARRRPWKPSRSGTRRRIGTGCSGFCSRRAIRPSSLEGRACSLTARAAGGAALFRQPDHVSHRQCPGGDHRLRGRAMGDAQPKYLNSPETAFFRKGENLFGLDKAGPAIRQEGCFILVEGYMDVVAMHQAGIHQLRGAAGHGAHGAAGSAAEAVSPARRSCCSTAMPRGRRPPTAPSSCWKRQDMIVQVAVRGGREGSR